MTATRVAGARSCIYPIIDGAPTGQAGDVKTAGTQPSLVELGVGWNGEGESSHKMRQVLLRGCGRQGERRRPNHMLARVPRCLTCPETVDRALGQCLLHLAGLPQVTEPAFPET